MGLNRPSQQLRRELLDLARRQEKMAEKLLRIAEQTPGLHGLTLATLAGEVYEDADKAEALAEEVKAGQIVRSKPNANSAAKIDD
jgi:hypothetical protein